MTTANDHAGPDQVMNDAQRNAAGRGGDVSPPATENAEPTELINPVPHIVLGLVVGLVAWGIAYILMADPTTPASLGDRRTLASLQTADPARAQGTVDGRQIFAGTCQACHQATGQGLPGVFPPLAGSAWVQGDSRVLAQIVLHGLTGPVTVAGNTYNGVMPGFGTQLGDAELAAVLTYIRGEWGNAAEPVTADEVGAARAASSQRSAPWEDVQAIPGAAPASG